MTRVMWPYRVAMTLLYGYCDGVERLGQGEYLVTTSPMANFMGLTNSRLRTYLRNLVELQLADITGTGHGWLRIKLQQPEGAQWK